MHFYVPSLYFYPIEPKQSQRNIIYKDRASTSDQVSRILLNLDQIQKKIYFIEKKVSELEQQHKRFM